MGTRPREARSNSTKICLACCSSASCATVRWGTTLEYLPPKGGVSGQQSQTALVSRRNGSSGSGTKYNTPPGKRRILAREKSNAQKPAKHWLSFSIVEPSISWGDLNGYSKVMCAGIPAAADGSYLSRKEWTNASACCTRTANPDSSGNMVP